jgi:hypothetical protein
MQHPVFHPGLDAIGLNIGKINAAVHGPETPFFVNVILLFFIHTFLPVEREMVSRPSLNSTLTSSLLAPGNSASIMYSF